MSSIENAFSLLFLQDTFKIPLLKDFPENILITRTQPGPFSGQALKMPFSSQETKENPLKKCCIRVLAYTWQDPYGSFVL